MLSPYVSFFNELINLFQPQILLFLGGSVGLGIIVGALPGLTAVMTISLVIGLTYGLSLELALVVIFGIYVGGIYGACQSAILLNIPGTSAAAAAAIDGYPLTKKGQAGPTIGQATVSSFIGTVIGMLALLSITPWLSRVAMEFASWEYFLLGIMGVIVSGNITTGEFPVKGWISGFLGLLVAMVGMESINAHPRLTFGVMQLRGGVPFIAAMVGVFGLTEVLDAIKSEESKIPTTQVTNIIPKFSSVIKHMPLTIQSGIVGILTGIVPGAGEDIAGFLSYDLASRTSKNKDEFGKGAIEGVIAAEVGNNAAIGGAIIPVLSLAIPGSPVAAVILAALWLHGIRPGPMLVFEFPEFLYQASATIFLASFFMLVLGLILAKGMVKILSVPRMILMPIIGALCVLGAYAPNIRPFDIIIMFAFGLVGYLMRKFGFPIPPLVLGLILGQIVDNNLRRGLMVHEGNILAIFSRPVSTILFIIVLLMILAQSKLFRGLIKKSINVVTNN